MKRGAGDRPGAAGAAWESWPGKRAQRRPGWPGTRVADAALSGRCLLEVGAGKPADRARLGWRPLRGVWRAASRCPVHRSAFLSRDDAPCCWAWPARAGCRPPPGANVRLEPLWNEHYAGLRRPGGECVARRAGLAWRQSSREAAGEGMGGRARIRPIGPIGLMRLMRMGRMRPMGPMGPEARRGAFPARGGGHARLLGWARACAPAWLAARGS